MDRPLPTQLENALSSIEARSTENGIEIQAVTKAVEEVEHQPAILTPRQRSRLDDEQAAGRRAVARHAESARLRPVTVPTEAEMKAQGSSVPVFRPNQFDEYRSTFASQAQTKSKG